jgi:broad specificity phosphatase PhoE
MGEIGYGVWLVRHAETQWSRQGRHTGRTDIALTDAGRAAARAMRARIDGYDFAQVFVSPLSRAVETCELVGLRAGMAECDDLLEWDYGDYEGITTDDIRKRRPDWSLWRDGCPGGETADDVAARADRVLERVRAAGGDVALVAHGHILRVVAARWVGEPGAFGGRMALSTGSLSVLGFERETPVVVRWNT